MIRTALLSNSYNCNNYCGDIDHQNSLRIDTLKAERGGLATYLDIRKQTSSDNDPIQPAAAVSSTEARPEKGQAVRACKSKRYSAAFPPIRVSYPTIYGGIESIPQVNFKPILLTQASKPFFTHSRTTVRQRQPVSYKFRFFFSIDIAEEANFDAATNIKIDPK